MDDFGASFTVPSLSAMKQLNLTATPIETIKYLQKGSQSPMILGANLSLFNNEGLPLRQLALNKVNGAFTESTVSGNLFLHDSRYDTLATFSRYDLKGNVIEQEANGREITTLYSYQKSLPVLQFDNLSYDEVKSYLGESAIESLSNQRFPTLDLVKNHMTGLPQNVAVTATTYERGVGIQEVFGADKQTVRTKYDEQGRVAEMTDGMDNLLKSYTYKTQKTSEFLKYGQASVFPQAGLRKLILMPLGFPTVFAPDTCKIQVFSETGELLAEKAVFLRSIDSYIPLTDPDVSNNPIDVDYLTVRFYSGRVKFRFEFKGPYNQMITNPHFFGIESTFMGQTFYLDSNLLVDELDSCWFETDYYNVAPYAQGNQDIIWFYHN